MFFKRTAIVFLVMSFFSQASVQQSAKIVLRVDPTQSNGTVSGYNSHLPTSAIEVREFINKGAGISIACNGFTHCIIARDTKVYGNATATGYQAVIELLEDLTHKLKQQNDQEQRELEEAERERQLAIAKKALIEGLSATKKK
jgi:hypothetical protein